MPAGGTRIPRAGARPGVPAVNPNPPSMADLLSEAGRIGAQPVGAPCDECGAHIPDTEPSMFSPRHGPACSLRPQNVAPAPPPLPEQSEAAALRAQLSAMADQLRAAEARAAEAIRARDTTRAGPEITIGESGAVVLHGFKQRRTWYVWPSQLDVLAEGIDVASLPASHVLRRMVEAAAGLPRRKEGGAK